MSRILRSLTILTSLLLVSCNVSPGQEEYRRFSEAVRLYYCGKEESALKIFEELNSRFPGFTENTVMYARVLNQTGKSREALLLWEELVRKDYADLDVLKRLSAAYLELGRVEEASSLLKEGLALSSEDPFLLYLAARAEIASGNAERAITLLLTAMSQMEKQILIPLELARIYSSYGMENESAELIRRFSGYLPGDHPLTAAVKALSESAGKE